MATASKSNTEIGLKPWESAALALSMLVLGAMSWALLTDFSVRRILWPSGGEGHLSRPIGKVTLALNKTVRQGRDQPEFVDLTLADAVYPLDTLMAGPGSALKIELSDGSSLEVGENSMVRLNFDSSLRLGGINRETVIEVVSGTVAAKGSAQSSIKIKSENRTFVATESKALELSSQGGKIASSEVATSHIVERAKAAAALNTERDQALLAARTAQQNGAQYDAKKIAQAREDFAKLGGTMSANPGAGPAPSLADMYSSVRKGADKKIGSGMTAPSKADLEGQRVALNQKRAEQMLSLPSKGPKIEARAELARISRVEPADNFSVKTEGRPKKGEVSFPIELKWKAEPDNALFTVRLQQKGQSEQVIKAQADDGEVKIAHLLRRPGDYVWKIEDQGGSVLSMRTLHVNSKFQAIELSDPVLIGRERGSTMWAAQDKWGFLFKWQPVKGVTQYKVRIARNTATKSGAAGGGTPGGIVAEMSTADSEFVLPFNKAWQAERMFFSVEGVHSQGFQLASNNVPFMFTFLPPKPRVPLDKKVLRRDSLLEGVVNINWEISGDMTGFTVEISKDPTFRKKIESEQVDENTFRFYPQESGKYYWHVRGDKDSVSSPFSETWEFTIK